METFVRIALLTKGCTVCIRPASLSLNRGELCVVELDEGLDTGTYVAPGTPPHDEDTAEKQQTPRVVRLASAEDEAHVKENAELAEKALLAFTELLCTSGVVIKPLLAHFTLGRERLLIVFGAPDHIDCRKAVGKLQWDFKTRVEIRHVGVRDEAAVAGGIGSCGRALCCATWMRTFRSVNVRMARVQELSLNPVAINGCCGRLKCCLRYEYDVYQDVGKDLPADGTVVRWNGQECVVLGRDVLQRRLLVRTRDQGLQHVAMAEVNVVAEVESTVCKEEP